MIENDLAEIKTVSRQLDVNYEIRVSGAFEYNIWTPIQINVGDIVEVQGEIFAVISRRIVFKNEEVNQIILNCTKKV